MHTEQFLSPQMHSFGISTIVPVAFDFVAVDNVPNLAALLLGELDVGGASILDDACGVAARKSVWLVLRVRKRLRTRSQGGE